MTSTTTTWCIFLNSEVVPVLLSSKISYIADVGERRGFSVGIFPEEWVLKDCHIQTPISPYHTLSATGRYGIFACKGYVGGWYPGLCPRYGGGCSIRDMSIPLLSPIEPQVLEVGHSTDRCIRAKKFVVQQVHSNCITSYELQGFCGHWVLIMVILWLQYLHTLVTGHSLEYPVSIYPHRL